jgi:hypothetical protein
MAAMMNESIYDLIPPTQHVPQRPDMHHSKFSGRLDRSTLVYPMGVAKRQAAHATFGVPEGHTAKDPKQFTRAHTGTAVLPPPAPPSTTKAKVKQSTPKRTEKPVMNLTSGKNFVSANAVEAILSKPTPVRPELPYTMKPEYGQVPKYLETNKKKVAQEKEQVEEYLKMRDAQARFVLGQAVWAVQHILSHLACMCVQTSKMLLD